MLVLGTFSVRVDPGVIDALYMTVTDLQVPFPSIRSSSVKLFAPDTVKVCPPLGFHSPKVITNIALLMSGTVIDTECALVLIAEVLLTTFSCIKSLFI